MAWLPLANILHHKLRSVLSAMGIAIGICMLITLSGLARGSLHEVADRWEAVDADLIVFPSGWGSEASIKSGAGLWDAHAPALEKDLPEDVDHAVPVFTWPIRIAGQDQLTAGVEAEDLPILTGGRGVIKGDPFNPDVQKFNELYDAAQAASENGIVDPDQAMLDAAGMTQMVIDQRLAQAGGFKVNDRIEAAGFTWTIVGIVPEGVLSRAFIPRRTAQVLFAGGSEQSTLIFVKLKAGRNVATSGQRIEAESGLEAVPLTRYRGMLAEKFGILFVYVDAVNAVALIIAFLFIMVTLYTTVLQRTREIAILKSFGAGGWRITGQVLGESLLLTGLGTVIGIGLSFPAAWAIESAKPLLTVRIQAEWIGMAVLAAGAGAVLSAAWPAWRATKVDMVKALSFE